MKSESLKSILLLLIIGALMLALIKLLTQENKVATVPTPATYVAQNIPEAIEVMAEPQIVELKNELIRVAAPEKKTGPAYRFNMKTGVCENEEGLEGSNENQLTECSDLSNRDLSHIPFGTFILYGNNLVNSDISKSNIDLYALIFGEVKMNRGTQFPEAFGEIKEALMETNIHIIQDVGVANNTLEDQQNLLMKNFKALKTHYLSMQSDPDQLLEIENQLQKIKHEINLCEEKMMSNKYKESRHKKFNRKIEEEF